MCIAESEDKHVGRFGGVASSQAAGKIIIRKRDMWHSSRVYFEEFPLYISTVYLTHLTSALTQIQTKVANAKMQMYALSFSGPHLNTPQLQRTSHAQFTYTGSDSLWPAP